MGNSVHLQDMQNAPKLVIFGFQHLFIMFCAILRTFADSVKAVVSCVLFEMTSCIGKNTIVEAKLGFSKIQNRFAVLLTLVIGLGSGFVLISLYLGNSVKIRIFLSAIISVLLDKILVESFI